MKVSVFFFSKSEENICQRGDIKQYINNGGINLIFYVTKKYNGRNRKPLVSSWYVKTVSVLCDLFRFVATTLIRKDCSMPLTIVLPTAYLFPIKLRNFV
jgi:hypothetical protein